MAAIEKVLQDLKQDIKWYCAYTVHEAVKIAFERHIHLFLIDIILDTKEPGDVSGLNFTKKIREVSKYKYTPLVFITSLEDPKFYSYDQLHCYKFIEKPFSVSRVKKTILEILEIPVIDNDEKQIFFQKDGIIYSIWAKDIIYIESTRRKIKVFFAENYMEFGYKTCRDILRDLDSPSFIQLSRNYIINRKYIEYIDKGNRFIKLRYVENLIEIGPIMKKSFISRLDDG